MNGRRRRKNKKANMAGSKKGNKNGSKKENMK